MRLICWTAPTCFVLLSYGNFRGVLYYICEKRCLLERVSASIELAIFIPMLKVISLLMLISLLPVNAQPSSSGYYFSELGTDDALFKRSAGCFVSAVGRSRQCLSSTSVVNIFAIKHNGKLYCSKSLTPVVDEPLREFSGRDSSGSRCTMKGWVH